MRERAVGVALPVIAAFAMVLPVAAAAQRIDASQLAALPPAAITILGEIHDNPDHHRHQAQATAAIAPAALVFEMLTPGQAARVTPALRPDAIALGAALEWEASGWPDFGMYHPIFTAAPQARVYGAALPRAEVRRAVMDGAAAVFGPDAARYGLTAPLPEAEQAAREAAQAEAHCGAMPATLLPGMVQAQRLRDAALARAAITALNETGGPVVVITGTGHARRDWGMPAAIAAAAPHISVLSLGQTEADPGPDAPFDFWLVTTPLDRPDPCEGLRAGQG